MTNDIEHSEKSNLSPFFEKISNSDSSIESIDNIYLTRFISQTLVATA
jgi:hypothetical protein